VSNKLIVRPTEDDLFTQRPADDYIDATALCRAGGKEWNHYSQEASTKEYISELSRSVGIPADLLVQSIQTGPNHVRGTWVHPDVAIHLAQWCSPRLAVLVSRRVRAALTTGPLRPRYPVALRRQLFAGQAPPQVPQGYWTLFDSINHLLGRLECGWGYPVEEVDLLDDHVAACWSAYRQGQPWATGDVPSYEQAFPEGRGVRPAQAYPLAELPYFLSWLQDVYEKTHLPSFLQDKYPGRGLPGPLATAGE
jgi:hypothetical protein